MFFYKFIFNTHTLKPGPPLAPLIHCYRLSIWLADYLNNIIFKITLMPVSALMWFKILTEMVYITFFLIYITINWYNLWYIIYLVSNPNSISSMPFSLFFYLNKNFIIHNNKIIIFILHVVSLMIYKLIVIIMFYYG